MFRLINIMIILFAISILIKTQDCYTQYDNKSRAEYIFDILRYVKWPNEQEIKTFRIGILDSDSSLFHEMKVVSEVRKNIHDKPVLIELFDSVKNITKTEMLFVNKDKGYDISQVLRKTGNNGTLIISENYLYHQSMINFIVVEGKKLFEINEERLKDEGLQVTPLFLALGVKSETDWSALYLKTEKQLNKEIDTVERQNVQIESQKKEINSLEVEIERKKNELSQISDAVEGLKIDLEVKNKKLDKQNIQLNNQTIEITHKELAITKKNSELVEKIKLVSNKDQEIKDKLSKINNQNKLINKQLAQIKTQQLILVMAASIIILVVLFLIFIIRSLIVIRKKNRLLKIKNTQILQQNEEILQQKEEIEAQRDEIERQRDEIIIQRDMVIEQRDQIGRQKQQITDSILYAQRIQSALLTPVEQIKEYIDDFFILMRPRDIVSGDFYWFGKKDNKVIIAIADCTGHGVPGAFMSMLGISFLDDIIKSMSIINSEEVLNNLRHKIVDLLHQSEEGDSHDGMDIVLVVYDPASLTINYSGAFNPLYVVRNKQLIELKADRMPIGISRKIDLSFISQQLNLEKGDMIYGFSDGYPDQFGGEENKKFFHSRLKVYLTEISSNPATEQKLLLEKNFDEWRGLNEQIDDVLIFGMRV